MIKQSLSTIDAACYSISATIDNAETKKVSMQFDLCHAVPQSAPDFIKSSADPNSPLGFVEVDKFTLQHSRFLMCLP
jgi:sulfide:quinone oxidoreductase